MQINYYMNILVVVNFNARVLDSHNQTINNIEKED
jgi:hypothetical protein